MPHKLPWDQTIREGGWTPLGFNHRMEEMKEKTRRESGGKEKWQFDNYRAVNTKAKTINGIMPALNFYFF